MPDVATVSDEELWSFMANGTSDPLGLMDLDSAMDELTPLVELSPTAAARRRTAPSTGSGGLPKLDLSRTLAASLPEGEPCATRSVSDAAPQLQSQQASKESATLSLIEGSPRAWPHNSVSNLVNTIENVERRKLESELERSPNPKQFSARPVNQSLLGDFEAIFEEESQYSGTVSSLRADGFRALESSVSSASETTMPCAVKDFSIFSVSSCELVHYGYVLSGRVGLDRLKALLRDKARGLVRFRRFRALDVGSWEASYDIHRQVSQIMKHGNMSWLAFANVPLANELPQWRVQLLQCGGESAILLTAASALRPGEALGGLMDASAPRSFFAAIAKALQLVWMVVSGELFMAIFTVLHLVAAASSLPCLPRPQGSHDVAEVRVPTCRDAEIL